LFRRYPNPNPNPNLRLNPNPNPNPNPTTQYSLSVGIVDYDPTAYLDTVGFATMEALWKKGVLKKHDAPPGLLRKLQMAFTVLYSN